MRRILHRRWWAKLLKALNNFAQFTLVPEAGAVSPKLLAEWVGEVGAATACDEQTAPAPLALVNLCWSLAQSEGAVQRVGQFLFGIEAGGFCCCGHGLGAWYPWARDG